jgi:hypothetical protein
MTGGVIYGIGDASANSITPNDATRGAAFYKLSGTATKKESPLTTTSATIDAR